MYSISRATYVHRWLAASLALVALGTLVSGCSMKEEMRRIEEVKKARQLAEQSRSTNLTGEQLFIRSCNTCHPSGKKGVGPRLDEMDKHFPTDQSLRQFLRKGKGAMPGQPVEDVNEKEMDSLIVYLRKLDAELKEANKDRK
jgi:mono/diheme cytochrome c family protein